MNEQKTKQDEVWYPRTQEEFDLIAQLQYEANEEIVKAAEAREAAKLKEQS